MGTGVQAWSLTAIDNGAADDNINFVEGSGFKMPAINNSARALMSALRALYNAIGGGISYSGSAADAYVAANDAPGAWSSYAEGQLIGLEVSHTNTGASTINVDGLGAKAICKGANTAVIAGDLVAGAFYLLRYDGTQFQIVGAPTMAAYQPLDATLTALGNLSWSSGSALVQFVAADTVALTLAPSVTSVAASNGAGASTPAAVFTNTTDNAGVQVAQFHGDRATPASNDEAWVSYYMSDAVGNQEEVARESWYMTSVTNGGETARRYFWTKASGGAITRRWYFDHINIVPVTNDGLALGAGATAWSDLYLAAGGVINWNNGNVILTHSTGLLEVTTGAATARIPQSSETSSTLTVASRNRVVACSGGVTLPASVFAANDVVMLDGNGTSRTITRGSGLTMYLNGTNVASATLAANGVGFAYYRSATVCILSGAFT